MHLALALLLSGSALAAEAAPVEPLDFRSGTLAGWEGEGFYVTSANGKGPGLRCGVCSSDCQTRGRTGYLHRTFVVPPGAGVLYCTAYAKLGKDCELEDNHLDVMLLAAGKRVLPKQVRTESGWQPVSRILTKNRGKPREYIWNISMLAGQTLRLALVDEDKRPGCHLVCSGFQVLPVDQFEPREFSRFMAKLIDEQKLPPASRYDTDHFMALSNADEDFAALRLGNCELIYKIFYEHFRKKGFTLQRPPFKLMVAIFDSQAGFEAYVGQKLPPGITGLYHTKSNRLLVYDFGQNSSFVAQKKELTAAGKSIGSDLDRQRYIDTVNRLAKDFRTGTNIATIMHEVAHQLSFNSGMLNREGDVSVWLAEGLATYCEATDNGAWQGPGEPNPERLMTLAMAQGKRIPLEELVGNDAWLRENIGANRALLGYAQSWALFRMLMQERPQQMRSYLAAIYYRRTMEHRITDFLQAFGDLTRLELRYGEYIKELLEREYHPRTDKLPPR